MKKLLLTFGIVSSIITFSNAQGITLGGGLAYGTEIDELGLGFDAEFYLKDNLSISPDLIIYFVDDSRFVDRGFGRSMPI
ncbi:hypothetical protein C900_00009 [Fulvivirga imtechensis AK7]|uniref:Outer membrane protein beta-barrel domain-containing protein n=1 Tax=Fulvivirga imtechensis AK7 TaxID=1237149 RepID=L8JYI6_9BACT|nr:hypothetical protein [Fulvivirga imtechensis]ELR73845.1 hypothetical protein C900_00009 [Fulvivirga imtechensis AK7]